MTFENIRNTPSAKMLAEYLRSNGKRCTPERYMVLASAEGMTGHFTVDELCARLEADNRRVAVATVYSTLQILAECGLVRRLRIDDDAMRYEVTPGNHHHLVCMRCGKIKDMRDPLLDEQLRSRRFSAFVPVQFSLSVYGICSACARKARMLEKKNKKQPSKNVISQSEK